MDGIALVVAQIVLGAAIGESACEFLIAPCFDWLVTRFKLDPDLKGLLMRYISAAVGVLIAFVYALDIPALIGMQAVLFPWVGTVLTGLVIGRGSNATHEFLSKLTAKRQEAQALALIASKSAHVAWAVKQ